MKPVIQKIRRFLVSEDGPTAVEYAVMLALIVVVCLTAISQVGSNASSTFNEVATSIGRRAAERYSAFCHPSSLPTPPSIILLAALSFLWGRSLISAWPMPPVSSSSCQLCGFHGGRFRRVPCF